MRGQAFLVGAEVATPADAHVKMFYQAFPVVLVDWTCYKEDLRPCTGSEIMPELREFERGSSMVINASVPPLVEGYLDAVARRLLERRDT